MSTSPVIAIFVTTHDGIIDWADENAAQLLNVSVPGCRGRNLITAFGQDRWTAIEAMGSASSGADITGRGVIRPRERKPRSVTFTVQPDGDDDRFLKWVFEVGEPTATGRLPASFVDPPLGDCDFPMLKCPECAADSIALLEYSSSIALICYLRCSSCGNVWTIEKSSDGPGPLLSKTVVTTT